MRVFFLIALLPVLAAGRDLSVVLRGVEQRYNHAQTLESQFEQRYQSLGRLRVERGNLSLRKPGRMRWDYQNPSGKVFVSDGKWIWFYSPLENRVQKSKLKASEDFRAPLAFLLGKLDFSRDFKDFELTAAAGADHIKALPKNGNLPYRNVEFAVGSDDRILSVTVEGTDGSRMEYRFQNERLNQPLAASLFQYKPPAGVEVIEVGTTSASDEDAAPEAK